MSLETRTRRIRKLKERIAKEEDYASRCQGKSGYCCTFKGDETITGIGSFGYNTTRNCINHSGIVKRNYEQMVKTLKRLEAHPSQSPIAQEKGEE